MSENTMNNLKIGVDVGGTKIEAVLVDKPGIRYMVTLLHKF